jgi:hypothetical protein
VNTSWILIFIQFFYMLTDNTRLPKHALNYNPRGRRDSGRPRKRWQCVDAGTGQATLSTEEDDEDDDDDNNNSTCLGTRGGVAG